MEVARGPSAESSLVRRALGAMSRKQLFFPKNSQESIASAKMSFYYLPAMGWSFVGIPGMESTRAMATATSAGKPATKSQILATLSEKTELSKKDVQKVFDALEELIRKDLGKKGPGVFSIPGLVKLKVVRKPATKERKGINPFTKEEQIFKAKPARNVVKAAPLKAIKDMV
jgi:nucleoid DNA-binding protein